MKSVRSLLLFLSFAVVISCSIAVPAQDDARALWQLIRCDISANAPPSGRVLNARAVLTIRNVGKAAGTTLSLRINPAAQIKTITANDAAATFRSTAERQGGLSRLAVTLPTSLAPDANVNVAVEYSITLPTNTGQAAISPLGSHFLPLSFWYPMVSNPYSPRGTDSTPFRLTVTNSGGEMTVSSGKTSGDSFEQPLNGVPFFVTGSWDVVEGTGDAKEISFYLPKGANADERKHAEAIIALTAAARAYFATLLGPAPSVPIRLVTVTRGAGVADTGTLLLSLATLERDPLDAVTSMQISEMVARLWIGGATAVRAEGYGVLKEGLSRFFATLFIEKQFGNDAAFDERRRQREAFASIARRDSPLAQTTMLDDSYYSGAANKGAMVWRLVDRILGRDAFLDVLKDRLRSGASDGTGLTLATLRTAMIARGGDRLATLLSHELDQATEMDLMIGVPQARGGEWSAAVRNIGAIDVTTTVAAWTEGGERLTVEVTIPGRNFGEAVFKTAARLKRAEIDVDKLYPQVDYANDVAPRSAPNDDPMSEASRLFVRQDLAKAETVLRDIVAQQPHKEDARTLLGRVLLAENKLDEAEKEFRAALDIKFITPQTMAWANLGLGEVNMRRGQTAQAARFFDAAVEADGEYAATVAGRAGRIKAEAAANSAPPIDESVRTFLAQLDKTILSGRSADLEALIAPGELENFVKGIVGSQPEIWSTKVLRTEQRDANRIAADVTLNVKQLGNALNGPAVLVLARINGSWRLAGVEFFEVR